MQLKTREPVYTALNLFVTLVKSHNVSMQNSSKPEGEYNL